MKIAALLLPVTRAVGLFCVLPIAWHLVTRRPLGWMRRWGVERWDPPETSTAASGPAGPAGFLPYSLLLAPVAGWAGYLALMWLCGPGIRLTGWPPSQTSAAAAPGRTTRGGTVSAWLAAILAGILGRTVGFGVTAYRLRNRELRPRRGLINIRIAIPRGRTYVKHMRSRWLALCVTGWVATACAQARDLVISTSPSQVGQYEQAVFEITAPIDYAKPFDPAEVRLDLELTGPAGEQLTVPAFAYQPFERRSLSDGGRIRTWWYPEGSLRWAARFAPVHTGPYQARVVLTDHRGIAHSQSVSFTCVPSDRRGFLQVSREDPRWFATSDGQPFFPIGQNLAFIGEGQFVTPARAEETLGRLAAHGANYVRVWAGCHDWAMGIEARKSAFGRSWNWRPPFAPHPDNPERHCIRLHGPAGTSLAVDPSHRVALRPGTRYRLSGRVQLQNSAIFEVRCADQRTTVQAESDTQGWTEWHLEFSAGTNEHWLPAVTLHLAQAGSAWIDSLSLVETGGGPELLWEANPNRPTRGVYNQPDCFLLDAILAEAERHGVLVQLTLFTRDLYMDDLADDTSEAYDRALSDARNLLRYAVARWGYSTSLAAWEYFNEMDPGRPTTRFYRELGEYLDQADPYRHLRSTSTWHPSPRDWKLPYLDFADEHFYLRPDDYSRLRDEVDAVQDRVALLRRHAHGRPAILGEFGLANQQWQPTEAMRQRPEITDFHNVLWASALSGASGTALYWWWDRLDPRNHYPHYLPLAQFLHDVPWTTGDLHAVQAVVRQDPAAATQPEPSAEVVVIGLAGRAGAHLWLFHTAASWQKSVIEGIAPPVLRDRQLRVHGLAEGSYQVQWWHTREGRVLEETHASSAEGVMQLAVPAFDRDLACRIRRQDKLRDGPPC